MTVLRVDGIAIAALGAEMAHLAEMLVALGEVGADRSDLGDASVAAALEELLGNWTRTRRVLVTSLAELGAAAEIVPVPRAAMARARALAGPDGAVIATGSIYLIADLVSAPGQRRASAL